MNTVYVVTSGAFKDQIGLLESALSGGVFWLKTGIDTRILVSESQIEILD